MTGHDFKEFMNFIVIIGIEKIKVEVTRYENVSAFSLNSLLVSSSI